MFRLSAVVEPGRVLARFVRKFKPLDVPLAWLDPRLRGDDDSFVERACTNVGHAQACGASLALAARMLLSQSTRISGTDISRFCV